jgi:hypothetical protein
MVPSTTNTSLTIHQNTIMPRLQHATELTNLILNELKNKRIAIKRNNKSLIGTKAYTEPQIKQLDTEKIVSIAAESLHLLKKSLSQLSRIDAIPATIPSMIPIIRTISSQLYNILPQSSQDLCKLSSLLGSIAIDSASITGAKFDFRQSNYESAILLDKVKLIVESKINTLYPNLHSLQLSNT